MNGLWRDAHRVEADPRKTEQLVADMVTAGGRLSLPDESARGGVTSVMGESDAIPRGDGFAINPPMETRKLAEELARRLKLEQGMTRLELAFQDGHLELIWRHERVKLKRLAEEFDSAAP